MSAYYAKQSSQGLYTIRVVCGSCRATLYVDGQRSYCCPSCNKNL